MSIVVCPIAIVGLACRLPGGVNGLDDLWSLLEQGRDAVTEVPAERWSRERFLHPRRSMPGHGLSVAAGIVEHMDAFDAEFFGISRKEAEAMDPQQRLMLELAWEALEDGCIAPSSLAGSSTAVYVGAASPDAGTSHADDICATSAHSMTGTNLSIIANRISYIFDLHGPSMTIDTACSSAMYALHQACQTLATGGADMALAGGVNLLFSPYPFVGFSQAHMLSSDGRCKVFDAEGNGYVRSEGGGLLLLQPLETALAQGKRIHAVIRAVGLNSDGRTQGIALPSAVAQESLLRAVYDKAQVSADDIAYLEAHGTGTAVGDPIETQAIGRALGMHRTHPLLTGSVKCHLGHLETASAMAGIMKTLLILQKRRVPPQIHINKFNPAIDFRGLNLRVPLRMTPLPKTPGLPLAGVNSFGFGGANGHVLLEAAPPEQRKIRRRAMPAAPLMLSARSEDSLQKMALDYAQLLERTPEKFYDVAACTALQREALPHRLLVTAPSTAECVRALYNVSQPLDMEHTPHPATAENWAQMGQCAVSTPHRSAQALTAFVYSGNGSQWAGMGHALLEADPHFAQTVENTSNLLQKLSGTDFAAILARGVSQEELEQTELAQPLLFVVQVGLTEALRAKGIVPDMVMGHSVGEVAAAWACGALSLAAAALVVHHRSQLQGRTRGFGRMAAVNLSPAAALQLPAVREGLLEVAGINTSGSLTMAGTHEALLHLEQDMREQGIFFRELPLDYAFHSKHMDGIEQPLREALTSLRPRRGRIPFISTVTGKELDGRRLNADYWWHNVRRPVLFAQAIETACQQKGVLFLEAGPHPVLQHYIREGLRACRTEGGVLGIQTRNGDCVRQFRQGWSKAWTMGWPIRLKALFPVAPEAVKLPRYPWNRQPMRMAPTPECAGLLCNEADHPLLGWRKPGQDVWENTLDLQSHPWIEDHQVGESVFFPAAAYLEMSMAAARLARPSWTPLELINTAIRRPLIFRADAPLNIRVSVDTHGEIHLCSRPHMRQEGWISYAKGRVAESHTPTPPPCTEVLHPENFGQEGSAETLYSLTRLANMHYGPVFRPIERIWHRENSILAQLAQPASAQEGMLIPPPLLDGGLQLIFPLIESLVRRLPAPRLPYWFERCTLFRPGVPAFALAQLERSTPRTVVCSLDMLDAEGQVLLRLTGGRARLAERLAASASPAIYATDLVPMPHPRNQTDAFMAALPSTENLIAQSTAQLDSPHRGECLQHSQDILPLRHMAVLALAQECLEPLLTDGVIRPRTILAAHQWPEERASLLYFLLELLERQGIALPEDSDGQVWRLERPEYLPSFLELWQTLISDDPAGIPATQMLGRAASLLREQASLPEENKDILKEQYYNFSPALHRNNTLVAEILRACLKSCPEGARPHVLEIGAAPGGLLRALLPLTREKECLYTVTDKEPEALERLIGQASLPRDSHVQFLPLDILESENGNSDPLRPAHCLLLGYCLHETDNIAAALHRCAELLLPGGLLVLAELSPGPLPDLAFGLRPGWWERSSAPHLPASRLMPPQAWQKSLEQAGFTDIGLTHAYAQQNEQGDTPEAFIVLARKPQTANVSSPAVMQAADTNAHWILLADSAPDAPAKELLTNLLQKLDNQNVNVQIIRPGKRRLQGKEWRVQPHSPADWKSLWNQLAADGKPIICIYAMGLGKIENPVALDAGTALHHSQSLIQMARGWDAAERPPLRVHLLTTGALPGTHAAPAHTGALGAARVIMNEMPGLDLRCIDLDGLQDGALPDAVLRELLYPDAEREVLLRATQRYGARVRECATAPKQKGTALRLECRLPGHLETLFWKPVEHPVAEAGEVIVRVRATGLNFRDVMWAMGLLPDEALENGFSGAGLGIECAGEVESTGPGVSGIQPGQRVICFGPHCFGTHVRTTAAAVAPMPDNWSFAAAASVPVAFFTAWYALHHLARMEPGERVLIHGAAGGVGLAALQIATHMGLEVFATAGSEDKRRLLRQLGAQHVLDSRSYAFRDQVLDITKGQGVDAVLNSLAGEGMAKSLETLKPFGRFLELGKRDFFEDSPLFLRPFRNNISFFGIDVDQLMQDRPELGRTLFHEMMQFFDLGVWRPLPHTVFAGHEAEYAFRTMQQARHTGKIVVAPPQQPSTAQCEVATLPVRADGSYIITGGLGGFGLATARYLMAKGAGALVLVSRSGASTPEAQQALQSMRASGCLIRELRADVTRRPELHAALDEALHKLPPLRGIVHAAAVLDDATLTKLAPSRLEKVMAPKVSGAFHLHDYTLKKREVVLDFFILYSSATTLMGNPGQAAYVAANMALEGLAALRRTHGLPALAVGWGAIADTGMLTRDPAALQSLRQVGGISATDAATALSMLPMLHGLPHAAPAVLTADWKKVCRLPVGGTPRFEALRTESDEAGGGMPTLLRESVAGKSPEEALDIISAAVTSAVASILRVAPSSIRPSAPLADMGMDSLMAVELGLAMEEMLGSPPPADSLSAGASVRDIAESLHNFLGGNIAEKDYSMRRQLENSHGINVSDAFALSVIKNTEPQS